MSANGTVVLAWANGEDTFCIAKVEHLLDLEDKCGVGLFEIGGRVESSLALAGAGQMGGTAHVSDIRETIRLGLIGGGMTADKAMLAVKRHVDGQPLAAHLFLAYQILSAAIVGVKGDDVGKNPADRAAMESGSSETMAGLSDPPSTASGPPSDGRPASSTSAPSGSSPPASTDTTMPTAETPRPSHSVELSSTP